MHGNRAAEIGDFFHVAGVPDGEVHVSGDLSRVKHVGAGMTEGRLVVHGPVGMHLGTRMTGGEIVVEGDAGDWVGSGHARRPDHRQGQCGPPGRQRRAR